MRTILKQPNFRRLFIGLLFSMTAESILLLALAIWAKELTGLDGMAGAAILAVVAPMTLAPLVGYVVDRFRRRPFLMVALGLSAVALTPLFLVRNRGDLWIIFAVGVAYGVSYIAVSAALQGLIKEVVPEKLLAEANGALQTVKQGLRLVGPLLGAGLYAATEGWGVAAVAICGFVGAALVISMLRVREDKPAPPELKWAGEVAAGVRHLVGTPSLRRAVIGISAVITVFGFGESVFFAFVDQGLHKPATFIGVLVSIQGVGGLLGGLTAARLIRRLGEIGAIALGVGLWVPTLVTSIFPNLWLAVPSVALAGLGLPYAIVGLMTLTQRVTPHALMGRTSAAVDALISGPQALAIGFGAVLVGLVSFRLLFAVMAVICVACGLYLWAGRRLSPTTPSAPTADKPALEPA